MTLPTTMPLQSRILRDFQLRVGPHTAGYVARKLAVGEQAIAAIGADGRTGLPMRVMLDAARLLDHTPCAGVTTDIAAERDAANLLDPTSIPRSDS